MGRHRSQTVEYFPHDTTASVGKTLTIIQSRFGVLGYAFWFKLLEWLGRSSNHFYNAQNSDDLEFLCRDCGADEISGPEILQKLADLNAIDKTLWEHRVIWSDNFVTRIADVYKKRQVPLPTKPNFCPENCTLHIPIPIFPTQKSTDIPQSDSPVSIPTTEVHQRKGEERELKGITNPLLRNGADAPEQNKGNGFHYGTLMELKEALRATSDKVAFVGDVFKHYHKMASQEEQKVCYGRLAGMAKQANNDFELILTHIVKSQDGESNISGRHLDFIQGLVRGDLVRRKGSRPQTGQFSHMVVNGEKNDGQEV